MERCVGSPGREGVGGTNHTWMGVPEFLAIKKLDAGKGGEDGK